jgi:hypothetical protein
MTALDRGEIQMPIVFEGEPPYDALFATEAQSEPTQDGVALTVTVQIDGLLAASVPIRILLEPEVARTLSPLLDTQARIVERWRKNGVQ